MTVNLPRRSLCSNRKVLQWLIISFIVALVLTVNFSTEVPKNLFIKTCSLTLRQTNITGITKNTNKTNSTSKPLRPFVILAWTTFYGTVLHSDMLQQCSSDQCIVVTDRKVLQKSVAVMFHPKDLSRTDLPPTRTSNQLYVAFFWEPPFSMRGHFDKTRPDFYNLSLTYRQDSSITVPYVQHRARATEIPFDKEQLLKIIHKKSKLVAWFVSNCRTESRREAYVRELQKYIPVDIYGSCGTMQCDRSSKRCDEMLGDHYKFYLSFENAICTDYITEKFSRAVDNHLVPIVLKRAIYEGLNYPRFSFIATDDFASPADLAKYLLHLDANDDEYLNYFRWKSLYYFQRSSLLELAVCSLCQYLQNSENSEGAVKKQAIVWDMKTWYESRSHCSAVSINAGRRAYGGSFTNEPLRRKSTVASSRTLTLQVLH